MFDPIENRKSVDTVGLDQALIEERCSTPLRSRESVNTLGFDPSLIDDRG